jgi:spore germination protein (amino acid permease)
MNKNAINSLQFFFLCLAYIGIICHVITLPAILGVSRRDAWLAVMIGGGVFFVVLLGISFIMKQTQQETLYPWLKKHAHPVFFWMIAIPFIVNIMIEIFISYYDTIRWTSTAYLPGTPTWIIGILALMACAIAAYLGLETIAIANGILLPAVILFGIFVMSGNIPMKDYSLLFPLLQHGWKPIWQGILYASSGWMDIIAVVFFQQHLKNKIKLKTLWITGFFLITITLGPVIGSLTEFGAITSSQFRYPAYEQWRLLTLGQLIEHVDFLSIYQWWVGSFIRISLFLYLIIHFFPLKNKAKGWVLVVLSVFFFSMTRTPIGDISFWNVTATYFLPISLCVNTYIFIVLLFISIWNYFRNKSRNDTNDKQKTEAKS